jgi:uncharacterized protein YlzI (FlbEa/FlbD family)
MSIRVKLNQGLLSKMRSNLKGTSSDILSLVEQALEEQGSLNNIHEAVKNGTEYSKTLNIESVHAANTSIIDMDGKLYLLTDRLMEVIELVPFTDLTKNTYKIRDSNWE